MEQSQFILETLEQKVNEMLHSGYCKDIFYKDFFAERILKLSDLNKYKAAEVIDNIYYYYKSCIEVRIDNNAYHDAERCYDIVNEYRNLFDYKQIDELDKLKKIIDENYKKDPYVKEMRRKEILFKINEFLIPACVCIILIGIISLIACFITGFKNIIWNCILIGSVISFLLAMIVDKFTR